MTLDPPRRTYTEKKGRRGLKDVDAPRRARQLQILGWSLYGGLPLGLAVGFLVGHAFLGALLGPLLIYGAVSTVVAFLGRGAGVVYMPYGSGVPRRKEYSRAEALQVRGAYREAIQAYEAAILQEPEAGEPYLRIARLLRDELKEED